MTKEDEDEANGDVNLTNCKQNEMVIADESANMLIADAVLLPTSVDQVSARVSASAEESEVGSAPATDGQQLTKQAKDVGVQVDISDGAMNGEGDICHNVSSVNNYNNWQSVLLIKFRRRLAEQEAANRRLLKEKDEQLSKITTNLYLLESKLRRDQETIKRVLEEKDAKLAELDNQLQKLLRLNRRLAASRRYSSTAISPDHGIIKRKDSNRQGKQTRRISWHNEVHVIHEYETLSKSENEDDLVLDTKDNSLEPFQLYTDETLDEEEEEEEDVEVNKRDENSFELSREINEACEAVDQALEEAENENTCSRSYNSSDSGLYHRSFSDLSLPIHSVLQRSNENPGYCSSSSSSSSCSPSLSSSDGDSGNSGSTASSPVIEMDFNGVQNAGSGLGIYYNRIMNNHRTVTKPKDVKFKKISRVKSRSLEELRGRLKRPSVYNGNSLIHDSHIVLEQEEIL